MTTPIENILRGKTHIEGHPALYFPMRMLIDRGHQVEFVLYSNFPGPYDVKVDWFDDRLILANLSMPYSPRRGFYRVARRLLRSLQILTAIWRITRNREYDFIYAHGPAAAWAQMVGWVRRVPVGVRKYGAGISTHGDILARGRFRAALAHPLDFANFRLPHAFLLMTDDNTSGQAVFDAWKPARSAGRFLLWKTGIDLRSVESCRSDRMLPEEDFIFFAGRFDRTKRQDRVIETLKHLHDGGSHVHLYLAGPLEAGASDPEFIAELRQLSSRLHLDEFIHFVGAIPQDTLRWFAHKAIATVFLQDTSNMGNVLYEAMAAGGAVIASDDGHIGQLIDSGSNGYVAATPSEAATVVRSLLADSSQLKTIRANARATALADFLSLEDRFGREVALIEEYDSARKR